MIKYLGPHNGQETIKHVFVYMYGNILQVKSLAKWFIFVCTMRWYLDSKAKTSSLYVVNGIKCFLYMLSLDFPLSININTNETFSNESDFKLFLNALEGTHRQQQFLNNNSCMPKEHLYIHTCFEEHKQILFSSVNHWFFFGSYMLKSLIAST